MTTYALLVLGDDGQVVLYPCAPNARLRVGSCELYLGEPEPPVASGTDRGQFKTFEIGRYSIDVMELPARKKRK